MYLITRFRSYDADTYHDIMTKELRIKSDDDVRGFRGFVVKSLGLQTHSSYPNLFWDNDSWSSSNPIRKFQTDIIDNELYKINILLYSF